MRLYKRGTVWWCTWAESGATVRKSTGCTTREAAWLVATRWERERADPSHAATQKATFAVEAGVFLSDVRASKAAAGTVNMYECKVGHLVRLMPERMLEVDVAAVDSYFKRRRDEGASGSTLHKEWVALRGVLRTAARRGRWTGQLEILKPVWLSPASEERKRRLTWPELTALLAQLDEDLGDVVRFAVATGARRSELRKALERDADGFTFDILIRGSKTDGSWATIPVPPPFRPLLPQRAWRTRVEPWAFSPRAMFPKLPSDLRCLNAACARARIEPVSYNDLRRSFASLLIDAGVSNTVVAKLLRHASTQMVDKVYGKADGGALRALVESQASVRPVYVQHGKQQHSRETGDREMPVFLAKTVGQDGLEPSANGLRGLRNSRDSAAKHGGTAETVRRPYVRPWLVKALAPAELPLYALAGTLEEED